MGRLRQRLDRLEGNAHQTMDSAQELLELAKDLIAEAGDGIDLTIVRKTDISLLEFLAGKGGDEFPLALRITIKE